MPAPDFMDAFAGVVGAAAFLRAAGLAVAGQTRQRAIEAERIRLQREAEEDARRAAREAEASSGET